ncbi:hypothetical protein [Streptomyces jumonjinensis]
MAVRGSAGSRAAALERARRGGARGAGDAARQVVEAQRALR